jgi:hypothetical protein
MVVNPWTEVKDMYPAGCPFMMVNPVVNSSRMAEMEVVETMHMDVVHPSMVVHMSLEVWLMYIQPRMEIEDVIVGCHFVVVTHWVKVDVVIFGKMEVI